MWLITIKRKAAYTVPNGSPSLDVNTLISDLGGKNNLSVAFMSILSAEDHTANQKIQLVQPKTSMETKPTTIIVLYS